MRLINTKTGVLEEFIGHDIPDYAILSHTWGADEVSYQDYLSGAHKAKRGYRKIQKTCELAAKAKIRYAWVDTCCIDKKSSAELSEAINSMYRWYKQSSICYAFLSDLSGDADLAEALGQCRWFTRGWTLQELIAPKLVLFFDAKWKERGYKTAMAAELSTITKIDQAVLRSQCPLSKFCVAQKLSWAARRKTTRIEDSAYCLLGLLDLNMPLLYGEGEKAFRRLQDEIIRSTADLSIFAWRVKTQQELENEEDNTTPIAQTEDSSIERLPVIINDGLVCGVLARSPAAFFDCSEYRNSHQAGLREFSVTNIGIKIRAQILGRRLGDNGAKGYVLPLNCTVRGRALGLRLRQTGYDEYLRADPYSLFEYDDGTLTTTRPAERQLLIALPNELFLHTPLMCYTTELLPARRTHILRIETSKTVLPSRPWPADRYDIEDQVFFVFRDSTQDFGILDVDILIRSLQHPNPGYAWVRCKFCALGWSSPNPGSAEFGIVGGEVDTAKLLKIQPEVSDWDRDSKLLAYFLDFHGVSKATSVRHPLPQLGCIAHVTFVAKLKEDPVMSTNPFWSIEFSYTLWTQSTEPKIDQRAWTRS